ncbi:sensor histidine kinase [Paenibacillus thermoaerophilus]|uniref:Sensor histidine kinase n=1 Tax=Paenibacillus thermoaerophilus TaxID=1215385 RepID=A0ABW2V3Z1_9BACL|nr:sensor histidine kinase [Paenibacillus thermoaerophilus]TMV11166.1 sensor histidine kinase [Paenibacillus thermoaerophilus]
MKANKTPIIGKRTIKTKLMMFVVGSLVLFAAVTFSLIVWFQNVLEDKIRQSAQQAVGTVTGNVDMFMRNAIKLSESIAADDGLLRLLRDNRDFRSPNALWPLIELLNALKSFSVINPYIDSIGIYNQYSNKALTTKDGIYSVPSGVTPSWLEVVKSYKGTPYVGVGLDYTAPVYSESRGLTLTIARLLRSAWQGDGADVLFINMANSVFRQLTGESELWPGTGIVVFDESGSVVYHQGTGAFTEAVRSGTAVSYFGADGPVYETVTLGGTPYLLAGEKSEITGWNTAMFIPQREIMKDIDRMKRLVMVVLAGVFLVSFLLFSILYVQIFTPIRQLIGSIRRVESGAGFTPMPISRMDELGYLQQRFNDMMVNEQRMRKAIYEQELRNKEVELKLLQSQMNPHFLYNTLDSIYWAAEESGNREVSDMVLDLSRFFRLSLSRGKDFVTVRETVEHLKTYIRIQQFRHTGKFAVEWMTDDSMMELKVIKLMLQPLAENAIVHGMEALADVCKLTIRIVPDGPWAVFEVSDTGIGIEPGKLRELIAEIEQRQDIGRRTYGLKNLYQRLRLVYGDDMRFDISGEPFKGTTVTIRISLSRLEERPHEHEGDDR